MINDKKKRKVINLILTIVICQFAGIFGSLFTSTAIPTWYSTLSKASFNPPNWIFGPVWTILYLLMGISLYLVWEKKKISIFWVQLCLNTIWSVIFFGLKMPGLALVEIVLLWFAILFTIIRFYKLSKIAAYLLIPYILWVSFAIVLNYYIVILN